MIDTLHLFSELPVALPGNPNLTRYIEVTTEDGEVREHARLRNLSVNSSASGTRIKGSLAVYSQGANLPDLPFPQVAPALASIELDLGLPLGALLDARVTRLDIGANLPVSRPVEEYTAALRPPPRHTEVRVRDTAYFKTETRELALYDKIAEAIRRGTPIPEAFRDTHGLRYELRLRRVSRELGRLVTAGMLAEPAFQEELRAEWLRRFDTVRFAPAVRIERPVDVKGLREELAARGVEATGGTAAAVHAVRVAEASGVLTRHQRYAQTRWLEALAPAGAVAMADVAAELREAVYRTP